MSFKKTFFKNILVFGGYNYASQIANFLSSIILSRLLLPEEYGYVALITVFTGFVLLFSDSAFTFAIIRSDYGRTFHKAISNLAFYLGILLFFLMVGLAYPISRFYGDPSLVLPTIIVSISFIISSLYITPVAILTKNLKFNYIGQVKFLANLVTILLMILLAFLGFSYWSLIIPQLIFQSLQYILIEHKVRLGFRFYRLSYTIVAFKKTKSLILNLSGFNLINYWARNADNLIIGRYYSSYDLGIYNRAYKMLHLSLSLITGLFGTVLYPSFKKFVAAGKDYKPEYEGILGFISLINFPIGVILILIPKIFVRILWGENWMLVSDFLPYFGLMIFFQTLTSTTGHIYLLVKKERILFYLGVVTASLIIASIIVGSLYSVLAIAISYSFCNIFIIIPLHIYVGFYRTFKFTLEFIVKFWVPKLILGILLLFSFFMEVKYWTIVLIIIYFIHLMYCERTQILQAKNLVIKKILNSN